MYLEIPFLALVLFKRDGLVSPASWWWAGLMFGVYRVTCCWLPPSCRRVDQAGGSDSIGELLRVKWCQVPSFQKQPLRLSCLPRSPQNSRNRWTERDRNMTWVKDYGPRLVFQLASIQPMYTYKLWSIDIYHLGLHTDAVYGRWAAAGFLSIRVSFIATFMADIIQF